MVDCLEAIAPSWLIKESMLGVDFCSPFVVRPTPLNDEAAIFIGICESEGDKMPRWQSKVGWMDGYGRYMVMCQNVHKDGQGDPIKHIVVL